VNAQLLTRQSYETQRLLRSRYGMMLGDNAVVSINYAAKSGSETSQLPTNIVLGNDSVVGINEQEYEATQSLSEKDLSVFEADLRFEEREEKFYAKGKIDTGSDVEVVSLDLLKRNNLVQHITKTTPIRLNTLVGHFVLDEEITLTWSLPNTAKTYSTTFYVKEVRQFDLLIGRKVMQELDLLNENKSVLFQSVLKMAERSDKGNGSP
jgi:hypothetical protein